MSVLIIHLLYAAIAPWLALSLLLLLFTGRNPRPSLQRNTIALVLSTLLLMIPIGGFSLARWIALMEQNPSIPLTALLAIALLARVGGKELFRSQDWKAAWIFGAGASLTLYPMGLGLTSIDPYIWGWGKIVPIATALISMLLLIMGNRFGIILLLTLFGILLNPMESTNAWDYLIDPIYGIISLIIALVDLYKISIGHSGKALRKALP